MKTNLLALIVSAAALVELQLYLPASRAAKVDPIRWRHSDMNDGILDFKFAICDLTAANRCKLGTNSSNRKSQI